MPARNRIPLRWKPQLLDRDGHRCVYCGETEPDKLTIDHLIPRRHGGPDRPWNLAIACEHCNGSKFTRVWLAAIDKLIELLRAEVAETRAYVAYQARLREVRG